MTTTVDGEVQAPPGDNYLGMSAYEIAYLMSNQDGDAVSASLAALRLAPAEMSEEVLAAAASSLVARELLVVQGADLEPSGLALAITSALVSAIRWTDVALTSEGQFDGAVYIEAPMFSVLCEPRMLGAWLITVQWPGATSATVLRRIIDAQLETRKHGAVFVDTKTLTTRSTLLVRRADEGVWEFAAGATDDRPEIALRQVSSDEVDALLTELLPELTEMGQE
jgi:hypothetical protein